ncbi:MAG TPA: STAS domain-containing protein [Bacteroidota bacterium]|nr:STAS domain-containing protein [Bacteroidota bacterium]
MKVSVSPIETDVHRVSLEGYMDIAGADEIDLQLTALTSTDCQFLIADLSSVSFMASIGIGTLMRCVKAVRLRGGNMVFFNPQPQVRQVLEKTMIHQIVPIVSDLQEACRVVRETPPAIR